jgi:hypothetical protein
MPGRSSGPPDSGLAAQGDVEMECVLQWLDDLDDLIIRLPLILQSSHTQRLLSLVFFCALGGIASFLLALPA